MRSWITKGVLPSLIPLCLGWSLVQAEAAESQPPGPVPEGRAWAVLIGVEKYHRVAQLRFTVNDVRQLADTLRGRGGWADDCILEMVDQEKGNPRYQPLRASLMAELTDWLARPGPEDQILVYFSGHGFRDAEGRLYLAPLDFDKDRPADSGIAVEWLRQRLVECKAKFKLLVLDACHAGADKAGEEKIRVSAGDLGKPFGDLTGVFTLASSTGNQRSQIWDDRQQSLFTYWLNQGLKGHADADGNGAITVDELYQYVYDRVTRTAKARFPLPQTPVRIVRGDAPGVPVVLRLRPQPIKQLLADVAFQFAEALEQHRVAKLGVLPFTSDTPLGEFLGANFGAMGHWCADDLEKRLIDLGEGRFSVLDRRRLQAALEAQHFGIADLASADALKQLSQRTGGLPVIAEGTLRGRAGRMVTLHCKLVRTDTGDVVGSAGGTAAINESEWAMLGRSAVVNPYDRRPEVAPDGRLRPPPEGRVIDGLDRRAEGPHPFQLPDCKFRVRVIVNEKEREGFFRGNEYLVPLRVGEEYAIDVENNSGAEVYLRLLVDGLNTLPQMVKTKFISTMEVAPRVNLNDARHWVLDPKVATLNRISGFVTETGAQGEWRKFKVVQAEKSLAGRKNFTDQLGLITAAFYAPKRTRAPIGTDAGEAQSVAVTELTGTEVGHLIVPITIRYVDADELQAAMRQQ